MKKNLERPTNFWFVRSPHEFHIKTFFNPENEVKLCPFYVRNLLKNSFIDGFRPEKFRKSALSQKHPLCRVSYSPTLKVL